MSAWSESLLLAGTNAGVVGPGGCCVCVIGVGCVWLGAGLVSLLFLDGWMDLVEVGGWFYPTSGVKNRKNSFRILSARFILVKGEGKVRDARGSEILFVVWIALLIYPASRIGRRFDLHQTTNRLCLATCGSCGQSQRPVRCGGTASV